LRHYITIFAGFAYQTTLSGCHPYTGRTTILMGKLSFYKLRTRTMKKTLITLAIVSLAIAPAAFAKETPNAETARLNQQQLAGAPLAQPAPATAMNDTPAPNNSAPTTVVVAGPPHDSTDTTLGMGPSPQLAGQPSTDTPYVETVPAPTGN
jgi:hypothetical protein